MNRGIRKKGGRVFVVLVAPLLLLIVLLLMKRVEDWADRAAPGLGETPTEGVRLGEEGLLHQGGVLSPR